MNKNTLKIIIIILMLVLAPCKSFAEDKASIQLFFVNPLENRKPVNACNNESCKALLKLINNAKESIDFAIYGIGGQDAIFNALVEAQKRGVIVRGVTDFNENGKNPYKDTNRLISALKTVKGDYAEPTSITEAAEDYKQQVEYNLGDKKIVATFVNKGIKNYHEKIMHNKFFVIDKKLVWTGSTNISSSCLTYNANNSVLISSKKIADLYSQEFNQMYEEEKFHQNKSAVLNNENIKLDDGSTVSIYFSPKNYGVYRGIKPLIESAQSYIYVPMFFFTHAKLSQYLIDAHNRGVDVRVILDATSANTGYSKHEILRMAGIPVKVESWGGKMHMKSAIVDDKYIIVGSTNWTSGAQNINDENMVIIENEQLAKKFKVFFNELWQSIPDKWLTGIPKPESPDSPGSCSDGIDNDFDGKTDKLDEDCSNIKNKQDLIPAQQTIQEDFQGD